MTEPRPKLLSPAFATLWALTFLTFFAAFQLFPTAPLRLRDLGASLAESGRFLTVFTIGSAGGALFTGQLGDRMGHRRLTLICAAAFTLIMTGYGLLTVCWAFYLLAPIHGVVWSGLITATVAQLGDLIPESRRAEGLSWYGLASPSGVVLGPTVGVFLFHKVGFRGMCAGLVLAFALLALLATRLPKDHPRTPPPFQRPDGVVWPLAAILFLVALPYGAMNSFSTQEGLAAGSPWAAAYLSSLAFGMVLMRLWMGWRGFGVHPVRHLPAMVLVAFLGVLLLAILPGALLRHILAGIIFGAGYSMVYTLLNTAVLGLVAPERRGAAFGTFMFGFDTGIGLGSATLGLLMQRAGFRWGWALGAALLLCAWPLAKRVSRP
jgi:MFS family permease